MKCAHIATLHQRYDTRILLKECASLSTAGFDVYLIVGDGKGDENAKGVRIIDVGWSTGRFASRLVPMWRAWQRVRSLAPDVIHFHDGMFLPFAILLALARWRVIYDIHEDYPRDMLSLRFIFPVRYILSFIYSILESIGSLIFVKLVAATPHIASRFPAHKTSIVRNFPVLSEFEMLRPVPYAVRPSQFVYIGGISSDRGIREMVNALTKLRTPNVTLDLAGSFNPAKLYEEIEKKTRVEEN